MATCTVSYRDTSGVEHAVKVVADSLYEAAAMALEAFCGDEMSECRPGPATILEVTIHPPPVMHRIQIVQLRQWLSAAGKSPREIILKQRLKERLG